ncbi:MAG TPA: methyltransferase dimerization domain-containing protein [Candidatus Binatia bacterium]|nr:methyltransferase dimerization domain-containing protein [Candidatus Binatia bacterium]
MEFENQRLAQSMVRLFMGYIPSMVIFAAARLELADHIGDAGARAEDLAQKIKADAAALYRVMRVLAGLGVLRQNNGDRFYLTPFGETLRSDSPQSIRDYAVYNHEFVYDAFRSITECIRTGRPAIDDFFKFLRANPEEEAVSRRNEQSRPYRERGDSRCLQIFSTANRCGRGWRQRRILISDFNVL